MPQFTVQNTSDWCNISITGGVEVSLFKTNLPPPPPSPSPSPPSNASTCQNSRPRTDAGCDGHCDRAGPVLYKVTQARCCAACDTNTACGSWVFDGSDDSMHGQCFLLAHGTVTSTKQDGARTFGGEVGGPPPPPPHAGLRAPGVLSARSATPSAVSGYVRS